MKQFLQNKIKVFAPATIANVGPGFDIFGLAINGIGDEVEAEINVDFNCVCLKEIINNPGLPVNENNVVVGVGDFLLNQYFDKTNEECGINCILNKKMKIGTGMGSSASSSVASAIAVNNLLNNFFSNDSNEMLEAVRLGEAMATKSEIGHPDNVFPALLGGFVFIYDSNENRFIRFEVSEDICFVVISPDLKVETGEARLALNKVPYNISKLVEVTSNILKRYYFGEILELDLNDLKEVLEEGGDIEVVKEYIQGAVEVFDGIRNNDINKLGKGIMKDKIITPVRAEFILGYDELKKIALENGALGFSISGSGPALFAVCENEIKAKLVGGKMRDVFSKNNINSQVYVSKINNEGGKVIND